MQSIGATIFARDLLLFEEQQAHPVLSVVAVAVAVGKNLDRPRAFQILPELHQSQYKAVLFVLHCSMYLDLMLSLGPF
jgi:hypothetical protein